MIQYRIALPKGSLTERLLKHLQMAGYSTHSPDPRGCCGTSHNLEFHQIDRRMVPDAVANGAFDAGITGEDIERNSRKNLYLFDRFSFARNSDQPTHWVLASHKGFDVQTSKTVVIGCELPIFAYQMLAQNPPPFRYKLKRIEGSEEALVLWGVIDAVLTVTETGNSIRAFDFEPIAGFKNVFESHPALFTKSQPKPGAFLDSIEAFSLALKAVIRAVNYVGVKFNYPAGLDIESLALPADVSPDRNSQTDPEWLSGMIFISRDQFADVQLKLHRAGAKGIGMFDLQSHL